MKKYLFFTAILWAFQFQAEAKQIQVSALSVSFSPSSFTAAIGDTIRFVWVSGVHTTTSTSVPAGAASWNAPLDNTHTVFRYVVKIGGRYAFQCNFHALMGMVGSFTVPPRTKVTVVKTTTVNSCSNLNSIQYKCTQSKPPFKVQLFRYGKAFGSLRTVNDTLAFTYSSLPLGSYFATARGNNGADVLVGKSSTKALVPKPTGVFDTHVGSTKATIKWNHYSCVKFFSVQYRKKGITTWTKINTVGNKDSLNLASLASSTKYQFRVAANDSANKIIATSSYSAVDSLVTKAAALTLNGSEAPEGIAETSDLENAVLVFPNPASTSFTIQTNGNHFNAAQLRNTDGQLVWSSAGRALLNNGRLNVNTGGLPAGTYFLVLLDAKNHSVVKKIVIER